MESATHLVNIAYIAAACLFIFGLKLLSSPKTAPLGNLLAAAGMLIAVGGALFEKDIIDYKYVIVGIIIGSAIGGVAAQTVKMTAMPQMVALFNGFGGAASALVASAELYNYKYSLNQAPTADVAVPIVLSVLIGALTFTGSVLAYVKLQELMTGAPVVYPFQKTANFVILLVAVMLGVLVAVYPLNLIYFVLLFLLAAALGVLSVLPIGGADMPVVISLLNSYSGIAACATGFVLKNNALIISGSLVGASGIILTQIMCKAMNRSLANVLFSAFGQVQEEVVAGVSAADKRAMVKSASPEEVAMILDAASFVVFTPGYGMAVAQAQHQVRELADLLQERGCDVKYAIHPVAGRMPGHMNVLLAEADVPYDQLSDMDAINPQLGQTDVAIVIGANDVVNPAARHDKASPIYGMPIIDVDKARTVMVLKRSLNPGFAGIDNELFYQTNTLMVFGDAKDTLTKVVSAVKEL